MNRVHYMNVLDGDKIVSQSEKKKNYIFGLDMNSSRKARNYQLLHIR